MAFGVYQSELRSLIHLLKYRGMRPIAGGLGRLMAESLREVAAEVPAPDSPELPRQLAAIAVPMHRSKKRQRGFNHAEILAGALIRSLKSREFQSEDWEIRMESGVLERRKITRSQSGLTVRQRRLNLRGAFAVRRAARIRGRHVLLVDDVYTTGATARACSRVLMQAGAASVWVITAARTQREGVAFWGLPPTTHQPGDRGGAEKEG